MSFSEYELKDQVIRWLQSHGIWQVNCLAGARDLSDSTSVAELLHDYYPKLVNMQAFPKVNSLELKAYNWRFLRESVLHKIGIKLSDEDLEMIVGSKLGAIIPLLNDIYKLVIGEENPIPHPAVDAEAATEDVLYRIKIQLRNEGCSCECEIELGR